MTKVRHILGISGGKDSAALAIYMKKNYPELAIEYYNADTGCELTDTIKLLDRLSSFLGGIKTLRAATNSPEKIPFVHFLRSQGGFLPSPNARWCTKKMKLEPFEEYVGDDYAISYVGIRGDEDRDGYISTKPNIQAVFPFRKNIWSLDVINLVLGNGSIDKMEEIVIRLDGDFETKDEFVKILKQPLSKGFYYSKKLNALLDLDMRLFNHSVFEFLKTTDYPVGKLDAFPLIDNTDVLVKADIFKLLEDNGVGVPAYYTEIPFEVDGKKGTYCRSRSGCYFCFFQQKIEWIWLYEQHRELFEKAMEFEKDGYTWNQSESLAELIRPERIKQIKLDVIKRQQENAKQGKGNSLVDILAGDDVLCTNCFI
jgi:hypothetical protein